MNSRSPQRTIALTDGVYAIALTLLVLTIRVPTPDQLADPSQAIKALQDAWPFLAAYVAAFITIGVNWLQHHNAFDILRFIDPPLLTINLFLLFAVSFMPIPTALYASALAADPFGIPARIAAVMFVLSNAVRAIGWVLLWRHLARHPELLKEESDAATVLPHLRRITIGGVLDVIGAGVGALVPLSAGVLTVALAVVYGRDAQRGRRS